MRLLVPPAYTTYVSSGLASVSEKTLNERCLSESKVLADRRAGTVFGKIDTMAEGICPSFSERLGPTQRGRLASLTSCARQNPGSRSKYLWKRVRVKTDVLLMWVNLVSVFVVLKCAQREGGGGGALQLFEMKSGTHSTQE